MYVRFFFRCAFYNNYFHANIFEYAFGMLCYLIYAPNRAAFLFYIYIYLFIIFANVVVLQQNRLNSVCGGKQQQEQLR